MKKIVTILGNRPQFIKAGVVSKLLKQAGIDERIVNTGQHYDHLMSEVFIDEFSLPKAAYNLNINKVSDLQFISLCISSLETILKAESPDIVLVYGDTNSTLAGTIAAKKLGIKVAHIEAGVRVGDNSIPEEYNRILIDHSADVLFTPDKTSVRNLLNEGINQQKIVFSGDVMLDVFLENKNHFNTDLYKEKYGDYLLCTFHRQENVDNLDNLKRIIDLLGSLDKKIIFPIHPRTRKNLEANNLSVLINNYKQIYIIDPVSYIHMMSLIGSASAIMTDSGGLQKEAFFYKVPCYVFLNKTPWPEIEAIGWQKVVGNSANLNLYKFDLSSDFSDKLRSSNPDLSIFGNGEGAINIIKYLKTYC